MNLNKNLCAFSILDAASSTFGNVFKPKELVPKTSQPSKFKLDVSNKSTDSKNDTSNFREIKKQPQRLEEFGVGFKSSITTGRIINFKIVHYRLEMHSCNALCTCII